MVRAFALVVLVTVAAPLSAQQATNAAPPAPAPASVDVGTPAQNLDCAVWASFTLGSATDPKLITGLSIAVAWFTGLYEGKTGKAINPALKARADLLTEAEVRAMNDVCVTRMASFSQRLQSFGK